MIKKGEPFPEFELPNEIGEKISLKNLVEKGPAVIFFYPKDNTTGCTREACEFRNSEAEFNSLNCSVVGVSSDSQKSHRSFKQKNNLNYPLLSDTGGRLRRKARIPSSFMGLLPGRVTFVIDRDGKVAHVVNNQFDFKVHTKEAINVLKTLN